MSPSLRDEINHYGQATPHAPSPVAVSLDKGDVSVSVEHLPSRLHDRLRDTLRRFVRREHGPVSLRLMLTKAVVGTVVSSVLFVGAFLVSSAVNGEVLFQSPSHDEPSVDATVSSEEATMDLIVKHECWMGAAPKGMEGKVPGHAVVTWPGADVATYGGPRAVGAGLEHVFDDKHPSLRVHAFCR